MTVVLGAAAAGGTLWFAVADNGDLLDSDPVSFDLARGLARGDALLAGQKALAAMLRRLQVERVVLAEGETNVKQTYKAAVPRFTLEVLLEFAAADAGVDLDRISRARIRSAHGLPRTGSVSSHASSVVANPLAPHWRDKRDVAALAALASS